MKILTWLLALTVLPAIFASDAAACTRHFYNKSRVSWKVEMLAPDWCGGSWGPCTVGPGQTLTLNYVGVTSSIAIKSPFYNEIFGVAFCHIIHSGSTGWIAVNDPADGDVKTCGAPGWPCPGQVRKGKRKN